MERRYLIQTFFIICVLLLSNPVINGGYRIPDTYLEQIYKDDIVELDQNLKECSLPFTYLEYYPIETLINIFQWDYG